MSVDREPGTCRLSPVLPTDAQWRRARTMDSSPRPHSVTAREIELATGTATVAVDDASTLISQGDKLPLWLVPPDSKKA